jgi:hypothetical protein
MCYNIYHLKVGAISKLANMSLPPLPHTRRIIWEMALAKEQTKRVEEIAGDLDEVGTRYGAGQARGNQVELNTLTSLDLHLPSSFLLSFPSMCILCSHTLSLAIKPVVLDQDHATLTQLAQRELEQQTLFPAFPSPGSPTDADPLHGNMVFDNEKLIKQQMRLPYPNVPFHLTTPSLL